MSNYCKNCYELTEELENHKRWIKDYKQQLEDAEEFANAKITQCGNLIKQLNETFEQLEAYKMEAEEGKEINAELKAENDELKEEIKTKTYHWEQCTEEILKGTKQFVDRMEKAEKTLIEIKEIAEHCIIQDICTFCDYSDRCYMEDEEIPTYDVCKLIIQKISECEVK